MAAVEASSQESLFQALNVINQENVSFSRSTVVLKKDANFFYLLWKVIAPCF